MSLPNSQFALAPDDRPLPMVTIEQPRRVPHLPPEISLDVGATYEHVHAMGMAAIRLAEARLLGSAAIMQHACVEISELAESAAACAKRIERALARHRRRNPEAGIRN